VVLWRIFQPEVGLMSMMAPVVLMIISVLHNGMTVHDRAFFVVNTFVSPQFVVVDVLNEEGRHLLH
jgi:hypothetical protein